MEIQSLLFSADAEVAPAEIEWNPLTVPDLISGRCASFYEGVVSGIGAAPPDLVDDPSPWHGFADWNSELQICYSTKVN
ncbi:hypothetical protein ACQPW1_47340 [Nocardia sp. CA-128927]|uniref:hypothetical protein n=1 Tax=Nocardia sp. CA-128927 TaxID=3239975 RepID=UPI003D9765C6